MYVCLRAICISETLIGAHGIACGSFQVKEVAPEARRRDATLSFAFVYPSKTGRLVVREVSSTFYCIMFVFYVRFILKTLDIIL